jgi:hypothetical protein
VWPQVDVVNRFRPELHKINLSAEKVLSNWNFRNLTTTISINWPSFSRTDKFLPAYLLHVMQYIIEEESAFFLWLSGIAKRK